MKEDMKIPNLMVRRGSRVNISVVRWRDQTGCGAFRVLRP